jgi:hypothetical protein
MRQLTWLCCLLLASAGVTTAAAARHAHHRIHHPLSARYRAPAPEILTSVGTPDCHVQGRLLRAANHCPPEAVAAAPR